MIKMTLVMDEKDDGDESLKSRRKSVEEGRKKFKVFNIFYLVVKWY